MSAGTTKIIDNPLDPLYPQKFPPYRLWNQQNYSAVWATESECKLHRFSRQELKHCFSNDGGDAQSQIVIIGDSRARQLAYATALYLSGRTSPWYDKTRHEAYDLRVPDVSDVRFVWSSCFLEKHRDWRLKSDVIKGIQVEGDTRLIIVGQHLWGKFNITRLVGK